MTIYGMILKIHENDNVGIALVPLKTGETINIGEFNIRLTENIDKGHKIALNNISPGENIIKYGYPIGHALKPITTGEYVHTHNFATNLKGIIEYSYAPKPNYVKYGGSGAGFMGYLRENDDVGIRNEIWIINTVGCVNNIAESLRVKASHMFEGKCDGIFAFNHPHGCSQLGEDHVNMQKILAGLVKHPNAAGVLVLGLGCENNNIGEFQKILGSYNSNRVRFLSAQDVEDELESGLKLIGELVDYASTFKRQWFPSKRLVVGLKCGGSDAFSGITANPLVGYFSDMLIEQGGTTILTEVPEMFGAETLLMDRCANSEIFNRTVDLINNFKQYYMRYNQEIYENPSPGNKKGGISTLEEKSLGCIQKGGSSQVVGVLDYGDSVQVNGLNLLSSPGNDIVSCTALTAAQAHLIIFTTGRGTPLGAPVPTVKVSSNSDLYTNKHNWIDFDAGRLMGGENVQQVREEFFNFIMKAASGEIMMKNELNGYKEIAIFKDGVTL